MPRSVYAKLRLLYGPGGRGLSRAGLDRSTALHIPNPIFPGTDESAILAGRNRTTGVEALAPQSLTKVDSTSPPSRIQSSPASLEQKQTPENPPGLEKNRQISEDNATRGAKHAVSSRVIVVGAGLAGLACAYELHRAGIDVVVVEARDRLGGRVVSFRDVVPGQIVEGGAEFIGANHPAWLNYARAFNLQLDPVTDGPGLHEPVVLGNKRLPPEQQARLYREMDHAFADATRAAWLINEDAPWLTPSAAKLDHRTVADWIESLKVSTLAKRAIAAELTADCGVSIYRQSWLALLTVIKGGGLSRYWSDTEAYRCRGGASRLCAALARAIGYDRVRLSMPAQSVEYRGDRVRVTCKGGVILDGEHVVLAVPPGTWDHIKFSPELPDHLRPQIGHAIKFLSSVDKRVWLENGWSATSLSDGPVSMTWDPTQGKDPNAPAALSAFTAGPAARSLLTNWNRAQAPGWLVDELETIHPGLRGHLTKTRYIPWPLEKWTAGGYSFPAPGEITQLGPTLDRGIGHLHFAGEHACYKFIGYMEGALQSGIRIAMRLAEINELQVA